MYMERGGRRSGEPAGVLIKKRTSSGCLIVKKSDGVGRFPESRPNLDRKRSRMNKSDSESSGILTKNSLEQDMRHYRNVEESRKESKRYILDENEESEDQVLAMKMRRSYDGTGVDIGNKAYLGSGRFGIDREYGTGCNSKDSDVGKRIKPCLDGSGNIGYRSRCKVSGNEGKPHALLLQKKYKRDMSFDGPY